MKTEEGLTERQESFCQYYAQLSDTYGNGVWSYALGYKHDLENSDRTNAVWDDDHKNILVRSDYDRLYNTCAVEAVRLLRMPKIIVRIREIKATYFDDDKVIDTRMMDIIHRGKDSDSIAAIKHRNDLKNRVTKQMDITSGGEPITALVQFMDDDGSETSLSPDTD